LIVNGRHHARGPWLLFPMQGSFSFIKTSRKNAAYRVKVEKDLVPPALALQPIVQCDLVIIRWNDSKKMRDTAIPPSCCVEVRAHRWPRLERTAVWYCQTGQHANPPNFAASIRLLRSYGQRPRDRRAAEQRYELATF
jgi:hypothetical protein